MDALRCQAVCLPTCQSGRLHIWITVIKTVKTVTKAQQCCIQLGKLGSEWRQGYIQISPTSNNQCRWNQSIRMKSVAVYRDGRSHRDVTLWFVTTRPGELTLVSWSATKFGCVSGGGGEQWLENKCSWLQLAVVGFSRIHNWMAIFTPYHTKCTLEPFFFGFSPTQM